MNNYAYMEDAVNELCHAMENDPERFHVSTHTMTDGNTGIQYWISDYGSITSTWSGSSRNVVFSGDQGKRLQESFQKMRASHASAAQQRILNAATKATESGRPQVGFGLIMVVLSVIFLLFVLITRHG